MRSKFASPETRAIGAIVAEGFLSRLSFGLIWIVVLFYAKYELQMSYLAVGFLIVVNTLIAIALKPLMGAVADRFGRKRTLVVAMVFRSAVTLMYVVAAGPLALFGARVVHGVAIGLRDPAIAALIADNGGKKQIAQSFAWYQTAKSFAGNAAKASGLFLLYFTGSYTVVFVVAFVLSALPLLVVVRYLRESEPGESLVADAVPAAEAATPAANPAKGLKPTGRVIAAFTGLGFLISATAYSVSAFFPLLAKEYAGLNEAQIGLILSVVVVVPLTGPVFGWLADHVNPKLVLSFRSLANIGSSALYLVFPTFAGLAAGRIMDDMGKAAFKPAWGAMAAELSSFDRKSRAKTMGYVSSGEDAGEVSGIMGAGLILSLGGGVVILPALLVGRMVLAAVTEVYTVVFAKTYLEQKVAKQRGVIRRLPMPVRVGVAVLAGFAGGFAAQQIVTSTDEPSAAAKQPAAIEQPAIHDAGTCTGNDTIDAIRRQTGGC
jgi:MFS family permease